MSTITTEQLKSLKPCPFCGFDRPRISTSTRYMQVPKKLYKTAIPVFLILCKSCGGKTKHHRSLELAVAAWNTRSVDASLLNVLVDFILHRLKRVVRLSMTVYESDLVASLSKKRPGNYNDRQIRTIYKLFSRLKA